jgi:hypothetical protein
VIRPESSGFWANYSAYPKFAVAGSAENRILFRSRSLVLCFERGNPCSRCHSKSLSEKCDEGARLAIADLGCNRLYRTPFNQQLYPFHQTHLPSPKLEARPNFSAESSLNCPDAHTDFSTQRIQWWSICLVCHESFSDSKRSRILGEPHKHRNWRGIPQLGQDEIPEGTVKMICRPQLPDSYCLYYKFAEKRRDVQHGADCRAT